MATNTVDGPNLLDLPLEVLETLVLSPTLNIPDICALSRVCWTLNHVVSRIWAKIAKSRWTHWGRVALSDCRVSKDWYWLCRHRYLCEVHTVKILDELMKKGAHILHMSGDELDCFPDFLKKCECPLSVLQCVLDSILIHNQKEANLMHQYYALFGNEYITWIELAEKWRDLLSQQDDPKILENGAVLLSQWMNPCKNIQAASVQQQLDSIAEQVSAELLRICDGKKETSVSVKDADGSAPSCDAVEDRMESTSNLGKLELPVEVVLDAINTVLYNRLHFSAPPMDRYYDLENSFIDKALAKKRGLPITMCIVYQAVARRLGVSLRTINFPSHFLLQIPPKDDSPIEGTEPMFIDAFARGVRRSYVECCAMINRVTKVDKADPTEVFMRMAGNIYTQSHNSIFTVQNLDREYDKEINQWSPIAMTSALSLQLVLCSLAEVKPGSTVIHRALHLSYMCLELNYATKRIAEVGVLLKDSTSPDGQRLDAVIRRASKAYDDKLKKFQMPVKPKERDPGLSYRIGMIMKHRRYDYRCVIYGWDLTCKMSDTWIAQMGVDRLPNGRNQPFYHVLVEDGTNRYASQENLFPCPLDDLIAIEHWEVGRYFTFFKGDHYVPNAVLKQTYCYD